MTFTHPIRLAQHASALTWFWLRADATKQKTAAYIVDVLVNCAEGSAPVHGSRQQPRLVPPAPEGGLPLVVAFPLEQACKLRMTADARMGGSLSDYHAE